MQHKTLSQAIEAIMNNECSIKNDDVPSLQRACRYVWPDDIEPDGLYIYYYNKGGYWAHTYTAPCPNFIPATEFCRLMDEDKAEPIDLGKVFDENYDLHADNWEGHGETNAIGREKFIEIVSKLLTEKSKAALKP